LGRKVARTKKACKKQAQFYYIILNYHIGHVPCEQSISVMIEFALEYGFIILFSLPSLNGFINEPGFEGVSGCNEN
jgi:hypothetical protein